MVHPSSGMATMALRIVLILILFAAFSGGAAAGPPAASVSTGSYWQAEVRIDFPPEALPRQERIERLFSEAIDLRLKTQQIRHSRTKQVLADRSLAYTITMAGSGGWNQFRKALSTAADPTIPFTEGPTRLLLQGALSAGEPLTVILEANLASGFSWELETAGPVPLRERLPTEWTSPQRRLGGSSRQTIHLEALQEGPATAAFLYRRPWTGDRTPGKTTTIVADRLAVISDLSDPAPADIRTERPQPTAAPLDGAAVLGLPTSFDWRNSGILTPVKDQGNCGSCWAFGTVGPFEANLLWKGNLLRDLSEEFLLSCNTDGYSCNGGWWAHEYHWNKPAANQTQAGAVLEAHFPYVASKQACIQSYDHPHRLNNWGYVGDDSSIPTAEAIKNAIFNYGPVGVAVCSGPAMQGYRGGVFSTDEKNYCGGGVNHAVVLVGWDDADNTWIMRNSWGSSWGEGGYMRILRGVSNIGYSANYVIYSIPFTATHWQYFPLAASGQSLPPVSPGIRNGNFEAGRDGSWTESSTNGYDLILTKAEGLVVTPHSALWAAWLGGSNYEISTLTQRISIPANAQSLDFYYWIGSEDMCSYDLAEVRLGTQTLISFDLCADRNTGGWLPQSVDLTAYRGLTLDLTFRVTTDDSLNSNFFLDDVSLTTTLTQPVFPRTASTGSVSNESVRPKKR